MPNITPELLVAGFLWYVAFLFSTTCHEASHALAAKLQGDETAARGGQVSLNPVPHIRREPFGMVVVPILSCILSNAQYLFGWASAPFDPEWERRYPRRAAIMALAGPAANFTLMLLAAIGFHLGRHYHLLYDIETAHTTFLYQILTVFFSLNLRLGIFNLIPAPPLDGSAAIMLFMDETKAHRYLDWLRGSNFGMAGLLIAMLIFRYAYGPVENFVANLLLTQRF